MARKQWRCYHCDELFSNLRCAAVHFGADESATTACLLSHERHLVEHIRNLENQPTSYRTESDNVLKSIMALEADHRQALMREEEKGFTRGLCAGRRYGSQVTMPASLETPTRI
jgi:hypothetical protein